MVLLERLNLLTWRGVSLNKRRRKEKRIWKDHNLIILLFWIDGNSQAVECHHRSSSTFLITRGKLSYFYLFIFLLLFMIWIKTKKSAWSGTARTRLHAHANVISTENCCLIASLFFSLLFFCCCFRVMRRLVSPTSGVLSINNKWPAQWNEPNKWRWRSWTLLSG